MKIVEEHLECRISVFEAREKRLPSEFSAAFSGKYTANFVAQHDV